MSIRYTDYRYEEAENLLKKAFAFNPCTSATYTNLGSVYFATSRLELAEESLRRSIALQENSAAAWEMLGRVQAAREGLLRRNKPSEALRRPWSFRRPPHWRDIILGDLYLRKGRAVEAEKNLQVISATICAICG